MEDNNTEEAVAASKHREGTIYILMKDENIYIGSTIQDLKKGSTHIKKTVIQKMINYIFIFEIVTVEV